MNERYFTSRNLALMSLFGALSSLVGLTTAFIPAPLPGLYGVIAIPVGTILLLTARDIVGKTGAATFTQFVSGVISTILPSGPPLIWIILPTWLIGGIVIDLYIYITHKKISNSQVTSGIAGLIYNIPGDLVLFWAFNAFLGWAWPFQFFLYGFLGIHALLGGLAGLFVPKLLARIKSVIR
jgi:hypothetical protein